MVLGMVRPRTVSVASYFDKALHSLEVGDSSRISSGL